jgi:hypothetical protein
MSGEIAGALALGFAIGCLAVIWPVYKIGWKDGYYDGCKSFMRGPRHVSPR